MDITIKNIDVKLLLKQLEFADYAAFKKWGKDDPRRSEVYAMTDAIRDAITESHKEQTNATN